MLLGTESLTWLKSSVNFDDGLLTLVPQSASGGLRPFDFPIDSVQEKESAEDSVGLLAAEDVTLPP